MSKSFKIPLRRVIDGSELLYSCVSVLAEEAVETAKDSSEVADGTWTVAEAETFGLADSLREFLGNLSPGGGESACLVRAAAFQFAMDSITENEWHDIADAYLERLRNKGD